MDNSTWWERFKKFVWRPESLAILGVGVYLIQAFNFAHTTIPSLDEGAYLYKGWLFAEGTYTPFQPYGVLTNKMPLSFLIPGHVQKIFGPGLGTGRYLAIFEGVLILVALWLVVLRISSRWLAAGTVWVLALSPAVIKYYSVAASQSLTACLLAWTLALCIGQNRPIWQLVLSSAIASLTILTRQNLVFVLPILLGYILWEHGWKKASWSALSGLGILLLGHLIFWPGILEIWAPWIPSNLAPQLASFMPTGPSSGGWNPSVNLTNRIVSAFQGLRIHFVALAGSIITIFFLYRWKNWNLISAYKTVIFLAVLFFSLLYIHSWASLDDDYCVYCFTPYLAFFNVAGVLLIIFSLQAFEKRVHPVIYFIIGGLILFMFTGMGYSLFEEIGNWSAALPVPRIRGGEFQGGFTTAGEFLFNKYNLEIKLAKKYTSGAVGALAGLLFFIAVYLASKIRRQDFGRVMLFSFLATGLFMSPLLAGNLGAPDCEGDIIKANELVGTDLARAIQPDKKTYWDGGLSVVPLLYAPQIRIYAPQINDGYSYREGPNSDSFLRFGLWNGALDQQWRSEADYFIIEEWRYMDWKPFLKPDLFEELPRTSTSTSCLKGTRLRIFKRIQ